MEESLQELFSIAGREPMKFPVLMQNKENRRILTIWLNRLSDTQDYKRVELRQGLAQKILKYLELAEENPEYRDRFFPTIERATETCGDRVALSVLHLGIAYALATADPHDLPRLANLIIKGSWAVDQLENIARTKVKVMPFVDEIEVYLAYPIQLKERLGLQIDIEGMLYLACSGLKKEDFDDAAAFINSLLAAPDDQYNILIGYPEWIKALESEYSKEYQDIQEIRTQLLEKGVNFVDTKQWYEDVMVALTKKALEKSG
jgi:C-terminal novel E3 ligase, LRR-interacting